MISDIICIVNCSYFSLIAGESTDISDKEDLALVLRYLDESKIRENLFGFFFLELPSVSAEAIAKYNSLVARKYTSRKKVLVQT